MNLLRALATVSSLTMVSRVLGFVRDAIIARVFGAGLMTDAFFVAFKIPNLLRRLFAEGAFSQAFVPILAEYRNQRGAGETKQLIDHVSAVLALALFAVSVVGVLAALAWYVLGVNLLGLDLGVPRQNELAVFTLAALAGYFGVPRMKAPAAKPA